MKRLCILIFLILSITVLFAQDTVLVQQRELDSLRFLIKEHPEADTARVRLLIEYAQWCFSDLDFLNGLKATDEARSISKDRNYLKGEGLYLKSMAIFNHKIKLVNNLDIYYELEEATNGYERKRRSSNFSTNRLQIFYELEGNRILNQYTNFDIFGHVEMPHRGRALNIESIISNLEATLSYFTNQENKEIIANLHNALYHVSNTSNKAKAEEHKKLAQNLFHELGLSYHELAIIMDDIVGFMQAGKEEEARILEIRSVEIYTQISNQNLKALCATLLGRTYSFFNRTNLGLEYLFEAEEILHELGEKDLLKNVYLTIAAVYEWYLKDSEKAVRYELTEINLRKEIGYYEGIHLSYVLYLESLLSLNRHEEFPEEYRDYLTVDLKQRLTWFHADVEWNMARLLQAQGKSKEARLAFQESISIFKKTNDPIGGIWPVIDLAESFRGDGDINNAIKHALIAYEWASETNVIFLQFRAADLLSQLYEQSGDKTKAFDYLKQYRALKDENEELNNAVRISELEVQSILNKRQREIELLETESQLREQENKIQRVWIFSIVGALASLILFTFILIRNNRQKQKVNKVLESTLSNLKSAQNQLIQSEKMASLGELTAGIAHEIQNPLNFVNNFSEVNEELLAEMKDELDKGNAEDAKAIANDAIENQQKILQHGQRADAIVKGMLQHSRTSSGQKEPTDINALCDEYLRLSYHGLRAKDKSFNAKFETDFDSTLPKLNVVPQDIGRVVLNLINNAFYAVNERANLSTGQAGNQQRTANNDSYEPTVTVSTKQLGDKIEIRVKDNGNGISDHIKEKIFQPFFTTKPTGQGTGLGLSLAYDIVTKGHGGTLEVVTKEGEGTAFIVHLPVLKNQYEPV